MSTNYDALKRSIMQSLLPMVKDMDEELIKKMVSELKNLDDEFKEKVLNELLAYKATLK